MAAPHLQPPGPDPTKKETTGTTQRSNQPALEKVRPGVMKKRWLRIVVITVVALLVILAALPLFININSFRPKIESEVRMRWGAQSS